MVAVPGEVRPRAAGKLPLLLEQASRCCAALRRTPGTPVAVAVLEALGQAVGVAAPVERSRLFLLSRATVPHSGVEVNDTAWSLLPLLLRASQAFVGCLQYPL